MSHPDTPDHPDSPESTLEVQPASIGAEATELLAPEPRRRNGLKSALVAGAVVVALAIGVGAFAAYKMVLTSSAHPEASMPGSVLAYAALDLDPGLNQQGKLVSIARKFPKIKDAGDPTKWISNLLDDSGLRGVDAERDLSSWLGLRIGVGLWLDAEKHPYALIAAESRDDAKARTGLDRVRAAVNDGDVAYRVTDGMALIAVGERGAQRALDDAALDAAKNPLSKNADYAAGRDWLPDDEVLTVWADLDGLADAISALAPKELDGMLDAQLTQLKGSAVVGARAVDSGLEVKARSFGGKGNAPAAKDPLAAIAALPGGTVAGAAVAVPNLAEGGGGLGLFGPSLFGLSAFGIGAAPLGGLGAAIDPTLQPSAVLEPGDLDPAESDDFEQYTRIQQAVVNGLSNSALTFAFTGVKDKMPGLLIQATADSAANADTLFGAAELLKQLGDVQVTRDGTTVTATSSAYAAGGGTLGAKSVFGKATEGAPDGRTSAVFLDVTAVNPPKELDPVKAVGVVAGLEDGDTVTLIRVIVE